MDHRLRQEQHKSKWLHNRAFLSSIDDRFSDWIVTVAFYAALHCFESLSAFDKNAPHQSHVERLGRLRTIKRYRQIFMHYRPLYDAAIGVRYIADSSSWIATYKAKSLFVGHYLHQIEGSVQKLTGENSSLPPIVWPGKSVQRNDSLGQ